MFFITAGSGPTREAALMNAIAKCL